MPKKKTKNKHKNKPKEKLTPEKVVELRATDEVQQTALMKVEDWEREQKLRSDYEKDKPDLAPWIGWEEYLSARKSEARIRAVGIIGAIMRGEKRPGIRIKYKISPNKLNAILNSEVVDDILAFSLGNLYSFQTACVNAILWKLTNEHDGVLATHLLDKMGLFTRANRIIPMSVIASEEGKEGQVEDVIGVLFAKGDSIQARQIRAKIGELVIDSLKSQAPE